MKKKQIISLIVFIIGLIMMVVGAVFLVIELTRGPEVQDGEYLVTAKEWVLDDGSNCVVTDGSIDGEEVAVANCEPSVIWKFTEIGKGTLTTNGHTNDYDFIWALKDGKLAIETDWLYDLENEYEYKIDKGAGQLILTDGEKTITFVGDFKNSANTEDKGTAEK